MQASERDTKSGSGRWKRWDRAQAGRTLEAQAKSGLSITEYAKREGLVPERLYRWRKALGSMTRPSPAAEHEPGADRKLGLRFIPAGTLVEGAGHGSALTVRLPAGVAIEVASPASTPPAWLAALIRGLGEEIRAQGEEHR